MSFVVAFGRSHASASRLFGLRDYGKGSEGHFASPQDALYEWQESLAHAKEVRDSSACMKSAIAKKSTANQPYAISYWWLLHCVQKNTHLLFISPWMMC